MKKTFFLFIICGLTILGNAQHKPIKKTHDATPKAVVDIEPQMAAIPGGNFAMGSEDGDADERPIHTITVNTFLIGKFELTVKEFSQFVAATNYETDAEKIGYSHIYTYEFERCNKVSWRDDEDGHPRPGSEYDKPVIHVSWNDADAYCKWLSKQTGKHYRLPTEAEWEYAAGNGKKHTRYSWGNNASSDMSSNPIVPATASGQKPLICSSKFEENKTGCFYVDKVGMYQPNDFGVYDMCGNVWEWCNDWYSAKYYTYSDTKNPKGPKEGENKVIRGASWVYYPEKGTTTYRSGGNPTLTNYNLGFRVVCEQ